MAIFNKCLLRTGVYSAPQGEFRADRRRLERLTRTFHAMKAAGIRVPVSWGHSPYALPGNDRERAEQQFWLGHHNAGYVPELKLTPDGKWDCKLDVPGCEVDENGDLVHWVKLSDGRQVKAKVGEVSVGVRPWRDGTGKDWGESLVHVALTPLPVAHGTGGFSAPPTFTFSQADPALFTLSLTSQRRPAMYGDDDLFHDGDGDGDGVETAVMLLRKQGIDLPRDTNEANFIERLVTTLAAMDEGKAGEDEDAPDAEAEREEVLLSAVSDAERGEVRRQLAVGDDLARLAGATSRRGKTRRH